MTLSYQATWAPLPRVEVVKALEREGPSRIPLIRAKWWGEGLQEQYGARLGALDRYPEDTAMIWKDRTSGGTHPRPVSTDCAVGNCIPPLI